MEIVINDKVCEFGQTDYTPIGFTHAVIEIPLDQNILIKGNNEIGVGILSRPEKLTGSVVLEEVEIGITYPNSTR